MKIITLADIPERRRNKEYIIKKYGVSRVSAWRLLTGRVDHICIGYHDKTIDICSCGWDVITSGIMKRMRNVVAYQLKKWRIPPSRHLDDIAQECYINAYQKSGIWCDMPEEKKRAYIANLAKRTANDYLKKETNYTDKFKNSDLSADKEIYPGIKSKH